MIVIKSSKKKKEKKRKKNKSEGTIFDSFNVMPESTLSENLAGTLISYHAPYRLIYAPGEVLNPEALLWFGQWRLE